MSRPLLERRASRFQISKLRMGSIHWKRRRIPVVLPLAMQDMHRATSFFGPGVLPRAVQDMHDESAIHHVSYASGSDESSSLPACSHSTASSRLIRGWYAGRGIFGDGNSSGIEVR